MSKPSVDKFHILLSIFLSFPKERRRDDVGDDFALSSRRVVRLRRPAASPPSTAAAVASSVDVRKRGEVGGGRPPVMLEIYARRGPKSTMPNIRHVVKNAKNDIVANHLSVRWST